MGSFPDELMEDANTHTPSSETWITDMLSGVGQGGRNDACARLAGYLFKKGLTQDVITAILIDWNNKNQPPMPVQEVLTTIDSIARNHSLVLETTITGVVFEDDRNATPTLAPAVQVQRPNNTAEKFGIVPMGKYIRDYGGEGVTWLVDCWLPSQSVALVVSPPESYKTWMLLDMAVSIATGTKFLGHYDVHDTGPALIIQQEDSHAGLSERLALILYSKLGMRMDMSGDDWSVSCPPDLPIYIHPSRNLHFSNKEVLAELEQKIAAIKPKVVLIDPLYSAVSSDGYMSAAAEQMLPIKTWRDKYGCSFVIAHHSKKNSDPSSSAREDLWGSQFLNAFLETGWQIRRNPKLLPNEIAVRVHTKVDDSPPQVSLTFNINSHAPYSYVVQVQKYDPPAGQQVSQPAQAAMLEMLEDGPMTQKDIVTKTGKSPSTVSRQMAQLESSGFITRMPDGKYKLK